MKILLTTSVIVEASSDEDGGSPRMEEISDQLLSVVKKAFGNSLDVQAVECVSYHWLTSDGVNSGRGNVCNDWVTDRNQADALNGLPEATLVNGNLVCDQCRTA